jgi:hypothetical protein
MTTGDFGARPGGVLLVAGDPVRCISCMLYGRQEVYRRGHGGAGLPTSRRVIVRLPMGPGRLDWCGRPFVLRTDSEWCCGLLDAVYAVADAGGEATLTADGSISFRIHSVPADEAARALEGRAAAMEEVACRVGCWGPYLDWLEENGDARRLHLDRLFGRQAAPGGIGLPPGAPAR